jgi:hypothetical protein
MLGVLVADITTSISAVPVWLADALDADGHGESSVALDIIFREADQLLRDGNFPEVDRILRQAPVDGASLSVLTGLLSITLAASQHLPARCSFFEEVWRACVAKGRNPEKLLGGLRVWSRITFTR